VLFLLTVVGAGNLCAFLSLLETWGVFMPFGVNFATPACSAGNKCRSSSSFKRPVPSAPSPALSFSFVAASDAQLSWFDGEYATIGAADLPDCCKESDEFDVCVSKVGAKTNKEQLEALSKMADVDTLVMNGDLTA
jgi:hypothetical protein